MGAGRGCFGTTRTADQVAGVDLDVSCVLTPVQKARKSAKSGAGISAFAPVQRQAPHVFKRQVGGRQFFCVDQNRSASLTCATSIATYVGEGRPAPRIFGRFGSASA